MTQTDWKEARPFKRSLADEGWMTPDTYDNYFESPIDGPAVYLFLLHKWDEKFGWSDYDRVTVAYVGMSKRLVHRWHGHPVLREIQQSRQYTQRWFLPTPAEDLRALEATLIQKFVPPWNIQGRTRGMVLA